uniref:Uncharacterized protein n=1 Tax=Brassica oleracea var. oleracea TaxID=109376 RepID=A0A0D3BVJ3_BRAOL
MAMQSTGILSSAAVEATSPLNHHHPGSYQAQRVFDGQRYKDGFRQCRKDMAVNNRFTRLRMKTEPRNERKKPFVGSFSCKRNRPSENCSNMQRNRG